MLIIFLKKFIKLNVNTDTDKKCKTGGIKYKNCEWFLEYTNFKIDSIEQKMLNLQLELSAKSDEKLNTYMFSNHDKNKFILLL